MAAIPDMPAEKGPESEQEQGFGPDAAQRVLRRAIEIGDHAASTADPNHYPDRALLEAAEEVGLDARSVKLAAAEERLGLLQSGSGAIDRLAGPSAVTVRGVAPGSAHEVYERVDTWMRRQGGMRRIREEATTAHYERRGDVVAGVQRSLRSMSGRENLGSLRQVAVAVVAVDATSSMVSLHCDLSSQRTAAVLSGSAVAVGGSAASAAMAVADVAPVVPWFGIPVSILAGWGILAANRGHRARSGVTMEGVLQRASRGSLRP